jgi:oxaloacetate decarboxylase alpha subunit
VEDETVARVQLTELALRDAHQSLFATRMVTRDMLPVASLLDRAGFWSLETWGGATFDSCLRYLNEDPWERIRQLKAAMPKTPMQMLLRGQNLLGYRHYADDVVECFVERAAANGVDVFRVFDALNDPRNLQTSMRAVKRAGKHAQAAISYALTPVHTLELYVGLARELRELGADSLCIKDMAGLLKPYDAFELVQALRRATGLPIQVHSHATTGMSVATLLKATEAGAELLDTTISSLAMGTSHSPTETLVEILRGTPCDPGLDLKLLVEIAAYFREVRRKYSAFESSFSGADTRILVSQVPGGMLSNLESQLKEMKQAGKIDAVLAEIAVVQKDFGYPPLVTPTSQIVGTQAVFNVIFGRYEKLTSESCDLLIGNYGRTPAAPNPTLLAKALKQLNLTAPVSGRPADLLVNELPKLEHDLKTALGVATVSRDDVLTYAMFPQVAAKFFGTRAKGPVSFDAAPVAPTAAPPPGAGGGRGSYTVTVGAKEYVVRSVPDRAAGTLALTVEGTTYNVRVKPVAEVAPAASGAAPAAQVHQALAPMPGTIVRLLCEDGHRVEAGDPIVIMEAMKMQVEVKAAHRGAIRYRAKAGDAVEGDAVLAEIATQESAR